MLNCNIFPRLWISTEGDYKECLHKLIGTKRTVLICMFLYICLFFYMSVVAVSVHFVCLYFLLLHL
jgi:hypothetical protein